MLADAEDLLPQRVIDQYQMTPEMWEERIRIWYADHKGMSREESQLEYLKIAQDLDMYGVNYFSIVNKKESKLWLGVTAVGLSVYEENNKLIPKISFPWNEIKNIAYDDKKFTIKPVEKNSPIFTFFTAKTRLNKLILDLCIGNHDLFMKRRKPDSMEVQQMKLQAREERDRRLSERLKFMKEKSLREEIEAEKRELEARLLLYEEEVKRSQEKLRESELIAKLMAEQVRIAEEESILLSQKSAETEAEKEKIRKEMKMRECKLEEEKKSVQMKAKEAQVLLSTIVQESESRAKETQLLKYELVTAKMAEKEANEKLLDVLRITTTIPSVVTNYGNSNYGNSNYGNTNYGNNTYGNKSSLTSPGTSVFIHGNHTTPNVVSPNVVSPNIVSPNIHSSNVINNNNLNAKMNDLLVVTTPGGQSIASPLSMPSPIAMTTTASSIPLSQFHRSPAPYGVATSQGSSYRPVGQSAVQISPTGEMKIQSSLHPNEVSLTSPTMVQSVNNGQQTSPTMVQSNNNGHKCHSSSSDRFFGHNIGTNEGGENVKEPNRETSILNQLRASIAASGLGLGLGSNPHHPSQIVTQCHSSSLNSQSVNNHPSQTVTQCHSSSLTGHSVNNYSNVLSSASISNSISGTLSNNPLGCHSYTSSLGGHSLSGSMTSHTVSVDGDVEKLDLEIEKERIEYHEKWRRLQNQLKEMRSELEVLKVEEKLTPLDRIYEENYGVKIGQTKYSTLQRTKSGSTKARVSFFEQL